MLTDCTEHPESELLIVEGKNAANALKRVRDRRSQAILALQGKIPNAAKVKSPEKLLENEPVSNLLHAIDSDGIGNFDVSDLRYRKLIILTDPDADGIHARVLITLLFYLHLRFVIEQESLFMGYAPLYSVKSTRLEKPVVAFTDKHYEQVTADLQSRGIADLITTRYKGLAGLDQELLIRCCVNPESRPLKAMTITDCQMMLKAFGL